MDNFDFLKLKSQRASAPEGLYEPIRKRLLYERNRAAQTRQQLTVGVALLLIVGIGNMVIALYNPTQKTQLVEENTEQILFETYFDNQVTLSK